MIETLRQAALEEADRRQDEVLDGVLTYLDAPVLSRSRIQMGNVVYDLGGDCSYQFYLPKYTQLKKAFTRTERKRTDAWESGDHKAQGILAKLVSSIVWQNDCIRDKMYANPCYTCSTCLERKSPWPKTRQW